MSRTQRLAINVVAVNAGWFACVLGAANGLAWAGPIFVLANVALHVWVADDAGRELLLLILVTLIGSAIDSVLTVAGVLVFDAGMVASVVVPLWMVALWANFATTLSVALRFLRDRWWLAVLLGGFGGASAYYGGAQFGALDLGVPTTGSVLAIAVEWAVVLPIAVWIAQRLRPDAASHEEVGGDHG